MMRRKICARSITAGPGSCAYWWESCPDAVRHCFNRHIRSKGGTVDQAGGESWAAERDAAIEPQRVLL
jgi:hypothetical protein